MISRKPKQESASIHIRHCRCWQEERKSAHGMVVYTSIAVKVSIVNDTAQTISFVRTTMCLFGSSGIAIDALYDRDYGDEVHIAPSTSHELEETIRLKPWQDSVVSAESPLRILVSMELCAQSEKVVRESEFPDGVGRSLLMQPIEYAGGLELHGASITMRLEEIDEDDGVTDENAEPQKPGYDITISALIVNPTSTNVPLSELKTNLLTNNQRSKSFDSSSFSLCPKATHIVESSSICTYDEIAAARLQTVWTTYRTIGYESASVVFAPELGEQTYQQIQGGGL